ncbi:hypothetical protein ABW19_dt0201189 [Dactylella cylindrospora]|nr:hypothetical protein ABW19_dt0201189 [Dactylella cylindrospora]
MDTLPIELLRRIATHTSSPTLHSLLLTSRKLRTAVHDWQVYQSIIRAQNNLPFLHKLPPLRSWEESRIPIAPDTPPDICARYVAADYRVWKMMEPGDDRRELFWESEKVVDDFVRWAGVLVARGHPLIHLIGYTNLQDGYARNEHSKPPTETYILSFCLSAYLTSATGGTSYNRHYARLRGTPISVLHTADTDLYQGWDTIYEFLQGIQRDTPFEGICLPADKSKIDASYAPPDLSSSPKKALSAVSLHELCIRTVGILGYRFGHYLMRNNFRWRNTPHSGEDWETLEGRHSILPPSAFEIPFEKFMHLPAPFGKFEEFLWCHLEVMTGKEFLEDGAWAGMYSYESLNSFDPCMVDVRMKVVEELEYHDGLYQGWADEDEDDPYDDSYDEEGEEIEVEKEPERGGEGGVGEKAEGADTLEKGEEPEEEESGEPGPFVNITASGKDGYGGFKLYGRIYQNTGKVLFKKVYSQGSQPGVEWAWLAFMTPFGIVGRWGGRGYGGYVWLWKEGWSRHVPTSGVSAEARVVVNL